MICALRHIGLVVRNLERSLVFYQETVGLSLWKRDVEQGNYIENVVGIKGAVLEWAKLKTPDGCLVELIQYHVHGQSDYSIELLPANKLGCSHIAFTVKNIDLLYETLTEKGYSCNSKPQLSPDGLVKVMYCHDPDGIILEMVEERGK